MFVFLFVAAISSIEIRYWFQISYNYIIDYIYSMVRLRGRGKKVVERMNWEIWIALEFQDFRNLIGLDLTFMTSYLSSKLKFLIKISRKWVNIGLNGWNWIMNYIRRHSNFFQLEMWFFIYCWSRHMTAADLEKA